MPAHPKKRSYLWKIYQWITLAMMLPLILFALIAFVKVEQAVLDNEYQANKKILYQVKYNITFLDEMIVNSILSMYYSPGISHLIFNNHVDFEEMLNEVNKIKTSHVGINPFIHSIYLYNGTTKTYYTTRDELLFKDVSFETMLQSKQELPKLKPLPRKIEYSIGSDKKRYENVITYLMYDFQDDFNQPEGALVVNASTEWLLKNIKDINMVDAKRQDKIIILDDQSEIVGKDLDDAQLQEALKAVYQQHDNGSVSSEKTGYFTDDIQGKKYLITYTYVDEMNWTLVKAQIYDEVFRKINILKYTLLVIIVAIMIMALMASIFISQKIYKPIGNLVKHVVSNVSEMGPSYEKDEISYLNNAYQFSIEQLKQYKLEKQSDREILKTYFLRKLIIDSRSVTDDEFVKAISELGVSLSQYEPGIVCIVKVDNRTQFEQMFSHFDRDLVVYGIMNISLEIFAETFNVEAVEMKNDHIAFILNTADTDKKDLHCDITRLWSMAQGYISRYYKVSMSIYISDVSESLRDLTEKYDEALNNSVYRLLFGKSCILSNHITRANTNNGQVGYSASLDKKLVDSLKSGNALSTEGTLNKIFFDEIAKLSYNNVFLAVIHLVNTLKEMTKEMNRARLEPLQINFNLLSQQLFSSETLQEQHDTILQICRHVLLKTERAETDKHAIIANTIVELIHADYSNPAMCLQFVADKLNLSAKQVSKTFNSQYARSVADYINDVRLEKATEWLQNSNLNMKDILQKIGLENESYFYKLFKKKYGVPPKEYVLNKQLKEIRKLE
ncbi:helix-turn-helix domain-containing protein [Paenibacillus aceris]|uniref:YesN/AraC family two-component response regulator n=1 Tax=Paenibacillus aceris TaxID=869555 RepID=A0ABS4I374_9BACL|nr:YesN/AraC family two-component response regulator [Paenibacillus aceris]NHW36033.1 AraC family transcriptional regulator [Paenibacillus aceris]